MQYCIHLQPFVEILSGSICVTSTLNALGNAQCPASGYTVLSKELLITDCPTDFCTVIVPDGLPY